MAISSPGIGSNINVDSIVKQLMTLERQPLTALDTKEVSFQAQLSAYGSLKGTLSSFQSSLASLNSLSRFQARTATSSDTGVATATATSIATTGTFALNVSQLAQSQAIVATGQASTTAAIGAGASTTISFQFGTVTGGTLTNGVYTGATFTQDGTQASGSVTITAENNSLVGIKDAINNANLGVNASIVGDGSATPYRLVLQSASSGANRTMKISVAGDAALSSLLAYDPAGTQNLTQTLAAQDAAFTVNGLALTSRTNTVSTALQGVNLTLLKAGTSTVTVGRDTSAIQTSVAAFVKAYNDVDATLDQLASFNATTRQAGPLNGDFTVRSIQAQLRSTLGGSLGGGLALSNLSQLGITFQRDGTLALDTTKLQAALDANSTEDFAGAFAATGKTTDSLVNYLGSTSASTPGRYALNVTTLATQGTLVGSAAANLTITAGSNDSLAVDINGTATSVTIAAGTYTAATLATAVQSAINGSSDLQAVGAAVTVVANAGVLTITSNRYGSASKASVSGNAAVGLFGNAPVATTGVDVAGTINGTAATGNGQVLSGTTGSSIEGVRLEVVGGATGDRGTVTVMRGFATRVDTLLSGLLSSNGLITTRTDGINRSISDLDDRRTALNRRLVDVEARYRAQFTALDTMMSNMLSTSNFLTQQLNALNNSSNR
ncbi:MAG: flagellar filament capping protein FliD [Burkholderiales bacterium]|nr:flagellar filament capping protein FliD [Burkholderiales bacterium]